MQAFCTVSLVEITSGTGSKMAAVWIVLCVLAIATGINAAPIVVAPTPAALITPQGQVAKYQTLAPNAAVAGQCAFAKLGLANVVGVHSVTIPGTTNKLFMELTNGGHPFDNDGRNAAEFNVNDLQQWRPIFSDESLFTSGHVPTTDGFIVIAGGHVAQNITTKGILKAYKDGMSGIRLFDPSSNNITRITSMAYKRWKPSLTLLPNGQVLINGGVSGSALRSPGNKFVEIFDPKNPTSTNLTSFEVDPAWFAGYSGKPFYPGQWVLPTGHVLMYSDNASCIVNYQTGKCVEVNGALVSHPPRPGNIATGFPFSGAVVMTALKPNANNEVTSVDIIAFGGSPRSEHPEYLTSNYGKFNRSAIAARVSHRTTLSWTRAAPTAPYTFTWTPWVEEDIGYPRAGLDATLLPNNDVVLTNGFQMGTSGFAETINGTTMSKYQYPSFWATLYQTDAAVNSRYTLLCGTVQPRPYHGTSTLTMNGTVLIAGADRNDFIPDAGVPWFNGTQNAAPVYLLEEFQPPYFFDTASKPAITSIGPAGTVGIPTAGYNADLTITYTGTVTSVVLVAPSAVSTSWNQNQRVVELQIVTPAAGTLTVKTPLNPATAPPQSYMLFLLNGKTYSTAQWVKLVDTTGLGAVAPNP